MDNQQKINYKTLFFLETIRDILVENDIVSAQEFNERFVKQIDSSSLDEESKEILKAKE